MDLLPTPETARQWQLRDYLQVLSVRRWLWIGATGLAVLAAVVYVTTTTPIYRASCHLLMQPTRARVVDVEEVYDPTFGAGAGHALRREFLQTQQALILSRPNLERTYNDPDLGFNRMPKFRDAEDPIDVLRKRFDVRGFPNTYVVEVAFDWPDPVVARRAVETLVNHYLKTTRERSVGVSEDGLEALQVKADQLRPKLQAKTEELQQFMATHNMVSLEQGQDIVVERLKALSRGVTGAETERIRVQSRRDNVKKALKDLALRRQLPEIVGNPVIRDLKLERARLQLEHSSLASRLGAKHPEVLAAAAALQTANERIDNEVQNVLGAAEADFQRARGREDQLRQALAEQEKAVFEFNKQAARYAVLKESREILENGYHAVSQRISEIEIAMAAGAKNETVFVVSPATEPIRPVRPRKARILALAGLIGLLLGVALSFLVDHLDTSIKSQEEVEAMLESPILGYVPALNGKANGTAADLITAEQPHSALAESFRSVRTALAFTRLGASCQQFAVTSALPGEGKTMVSANLAIALAQSGKRVLVIDSDLRRPRLTKALQLPANKGLSNILAGADRICPAEFIQNTPIKNLDAMASGPVPPNPAELLGGERLREFLADIETDYDCILFDTPPVHSVTDAVVLGASLHGIVLVVQMFSSDRSLVAHARKVLDRGGVKILGTVLNGVAAPKSAYGYGYYSAHSYGYHDNGGNGKPKKEPALK